VDGGKERDDERGQHSTKGLGGCWCWILVCAACKRSSCVIQRSLKLDMDSQTVGGGGGGRKVYSELSGCASGCCAESGAVRFYPAVLTRARVRVASHVGIGCEGRLESEPSSADSANPVAAETD
jgi:hypothetical protein